MTQSDRTEWFAREIVPCETSLRNWLARRFPRFSKTDLDDIMQECYGRLLEVEYTQISNPRAYFFTVARHLVAEILRHQRVVPIDIRANPGLDIPDEANDAERGASYQSEVERLHRAVGKLPPKCRLVFSLRTFEDLSQREIAQRTGLAESTVEKHLAKGLRLVLQEMRIIEPTAVPDTRKIHEIRRTKGS